MLKMTLKDAYMIGFKDGFHWDPAGDADEVKAKAEKNWDSFFAGHVEVKEEDNGELQAE